jgi:hypothetical protein
MAMTMAARTTHRQPFRYPDKASHCLQNYPLNCLQNFPLNLLSNLPAKTPKKAKTTRRQAPARRR